MKNNVITLTISNKLIAEIDKVRGPEARASYIRRAIASMLSKEVVTVQEVAQVAERVEAQG
jgi:hypothetical protein